MSDEEPLTESASIVEDLTIALQEGSALPEDLAEKMSTLSSWSPSDCLFPPSVPCVPPCVMSWNRGTRMSSVLSSVPKFFCPSSWPEDSATELSEDQLTLLKTLTITWPDDGDVVERLSSLFSKLGGSMASSTSYAKVILQLLKAAPKGSLSETAKQNLSNAIAVNKTALRKVLEKTLAGV
ncbi:hypothetical protein B566_EDAN002391 [Ephemera danica]|nr:hypothetical protein B566_EDAN002391 [Ephemera danica]